MQFAERGKRRKKRMDRALVDAKGKFTTLEAFQFGQALFDFIAEIDKALGIVPKKSPRIGQANGTGSADKKGLAEGVFELAYREADGRLSAIKALGCARETAFFRDCQKNLEFTKIHKIPLVA